MGRIGSWKLSWETKNIMGAILTLSQSQKIRAKTVKKMRDTRLVVDASTEEGDVDIQDDIDLDGLSRMASAALGHDQPAVPSDDFRANISAGVLPHTAVPEPAGLSVAADKGKAPMPELDIPAEFLAEDAQARNESRKTTLSHNGTITMNAVKAMTKHQLIEEYEYICRRLEKDRLLSAQYNLFRPKPAISEPPSKRQRVERGTSQPSSVPAATTQPADDPDSAGGGSSHPAGSATPLSGSAAPNTTGGAFGAIITDSTVTTTAAMDSAGSYRNIGVSPFADSAAGGINEFFLDSDEDEQIGMSRVAADPDSDDEVLAEIIFRGKSISGDGVVLVDKLPDDEIVDPRVKVETVSDYASSPPRNRRKHLGVRSDDCLWDKPVEDFFSSESESDDDMENYIPPLPYGEFKDWEMALQLPPFIRSEVVVAGTIIQTGPDCLRQSSEGLASAHYIVLYTFGVSACTARQMVFSSPWLNHQKALAHLLKRLGVFLSNPLLIAVKGLLKS
ncbi:hypothetical protein Tco_1098939 [Tanacetum coccineum]